MANSLASNMSAIVPAHECSLPERDMGMTAGIILVGGLVTAVLYGMSVMQTFVYYQHGCQHDGRLVKTVVTSLWLVDTFDTILVSHSLYWFLVINYGNPASLEEVSWSISAHLLVTAVTRAAVRSMFTLRLWQFSGKKLFHVVVVGSVTLLGLAFGIVVGLRSISQTFGQHTEDTAFVAAEFANELLGDIFVAFFMCYFLYKSRTGVFRADKIVASLMAYIINTGFLTIGILTASIIAFATERHSLTFVALHFVIGKVHINSYLAMLNARESLRQRMNHATFTVHLSRFQTAPRIANDTPTGPAEDDTHDINNPSTASSVQHASTRAPALRTVRSRGFLRAMGSVRPDSGPANYTYHGARTSEEVPSRAVASLP
ncbi:hypothetical protein PsYK624_049540 [Phanerochaete sordida]|uniref:DUF6534 domain-containing protein n=1 Tax=Phanerochaete sordida TaxID=48140 RepID=A0A9P3G493_9APHY|nr:hypothetical protein PsYK624_049540 [Phanerochaete sordida]